VDLNAFDTVTAANEGAVLELRGPNGEPLKQDGGKKPVSITLYGADSEVARKARNAAANRYLKQRGKVQITAEGSEADALSFLAKCTAAWDGIVVDGKALPCDRENVMQVYERFPFIREQVDEFIADRANFLKASSKN
jgi:hypothetical protein